METLGNLLAFMHGSGGGGVSLWVASETFQHLRLSLQFPFCKVQISKLDGLRGKVAEQKTQGTGVSSVSESGMLTYPPAYPHAHMYQAQDELPGTLMGDLPILWGFHKQTGGLFIQFGGNLWNSAVGSVPRALLGEEWGMMLVLWAVCFAVGTEKEKILFLQEAPRHSCRDRRSPLPRQVGFCPSEPS